MMRWSLEVGGWPGGCPWRRTTTSRAWGKAGLLDTFEGGRQLIVYRAFFEVDSPSANPRGELNPS